MIDAGTFGGMWLVPRSTTIERACTCTCVVHGTLILAWSKRSLGVSGVNARNRGRDARASRRTRERDDTQRCCTKHEPRDAQEGLGECRVQTETLEDHRHVSFYTDPWDAFLHRYMTGEKQYVKCVVSSIGTWPT